jgi:diaminopimelate decarboxylase
VEDKLPDSALGPILFPKHWEAESCLGLGWLRRNAQLFLAEVSLEEIANSYGTPLFIYSRDIISAQVERVKAILPPECDLHYAVKANPNPETLAFMRDLVDGADVASVGELDLAIKAGFDPLKIGFAGPGKTREEILSALKQGVTLTAESAHQVQLVGMSPSAQRKIALRINPNYELRGSGMRMGGGSSAFGIDEEQIPETISLAHSMGLSVVGFHIYAGSQNLDGQVIATTIAQATEIASALINSHLMPHQQEHAFEWLNVGGGFGVPYFPGEKTLDLHPIQLALNDAARSLKQLGTRLRVELGRFLVAEAGVYLSKIIDKKHSRGINYLVLDGGLHHNQAACGNFGQVIKRPYPIALSKARVFTAASLATCHEAPSRSEEGKYHLVGPLCTPMDTLAKDLTMGAPEIGDFVAVFRSGAYGPSASPTSFLGHQRPIEVLL